MTSAKVVSPSEWRAHRLVLLEKEKEHTRANDALSALRRSLPMVEIEKAYTFTSLDSQGNEVALSLSDLFAGHRQLIIYHFMHGPHSESFCRGCTLTCDQIGPLKYFNDKNTAIVCVSRAPAFRLQAQRARMGWEFPWVSSLESDFNYDFHASQNPDIAPFECNFRTEQEMKDRGISYGKGEQQGFSCFIKGDGEGIGEVGKIYHTYSGYARAIEPADGFFGWMEFTKLGRQDGASNK